MPEPTVISIDTETTSLTRPHLRNGRRIWDFGLVRREPDGTRNELQAFVRLADLGLFEMIPTRTAADTRIPLVDRLRQNLPAEVRKALDVGGFWERHPEIAEYTDQHRPAVLAEKQLAELLVSGWLAPGRGEHTKPILIGAVPSFDEHSMFDMLHRHNWITGNTPWNYQLVDIEALAGGKLGIQPPWSSNDLARAVGVDPDRYARHSALPDARWALDVYEAVFQPQRAEEPAPQPTLALTVEPDEPAAPEEQPDAAREAREAGEDEPAGAA